MLDVIRRVISGEDIQEQGDSEDHDGVGMQIEESSSANQSPPFYSASQQASQPAIVENDIEMETTDFRIERASETPRSSLSDMSAAQRLEDIMDEQHAMEDTHESMEADLSQADDAAPTHEMKRSDLGQEAMHELRNFGRSDSRMTDRSSETSSVGKTGSSQTSSRDWGWFEDVHTSEGNLNAESLAAASRKPRADPNASSTKRKGSRSTKRKGLVPSPPDNIHTETLQPIVQRDPETG